MKHPTLYQINTRILLQERGVGLGRAATLDDVPDSLLDHIARQGFDYVWFLGVWQTGLVGQQISRTNRELRTACLHCLPDMTDKDVCGSPFAIRNSTFALSGRSPVCYWERGLQAASECERRR